MVVAGSYVGRSKYRASKPASSDRRGAAADHSNDETDEELIDDSDAPNSGTVLSTLLTLVRE